MTQPWRPPAASTADWRRDTDDVSLSIEQMIRLGSTEYEQTEWALLQLRLVTHLCDTELVQRIDELLDLADEIAEADRSLDKHAADRHHAAIDDYEAALHRFAHPTFPVDDPMAIADVLQEPARLAPLYVLTGGGQS
jgi:hypothetical protein